MQISKGNLPSLNDYWGKHRALITRVDKPSRVQMRQLGPYPTLPYPTLPYPTLPYPSLPYPTLPYPTPPHPTPPHPTPPTPTPLHPTHPPYPTPTLTYPTLPYSTLPTWQAFLLKGHFVLYGIIQFEQQILLFDF